MAAAPPTPAQVAGATTSRNIILCCDGTNNEFGKYNTNVVRLFQCLDRSPQSRQIAYYDPGIGTLAAPGVWTKVGKAISRAIELAFGVGIIPKIESALSFLMQQYQPGDNIFVFGFSRGAYTARALAGVLHKCGLPEDGADNMLPYFMKAFQDTSPEYRPIAEQFKATFGRPCHVHFLGLWDTVSTIGWIYNPKHFPYTSNNPNVSIVRHAVSLDERRCFYRSNLWGMRDPEEAANQPNPELKQDVFQAWFPGVHSDVGGGYSMVTDPNSPETSAIWKISFDWMIREAAQAGVRFDDDRINHFLNLSPPAGGDWYNTFIHKSLHGAWWLLEFLPKKYWDWSAHPPQYRFQLPMGRPRYVAKGQRLHRSIIDRMLAKPEYRPPNLDLTPQPPATEFVQY
jgi:uncharacterized protein (DUF2235 family)